MAKRFLADGENRTLVFSSGSGLSWSFDRSVVTVDPDGEPVGQDEPRADQLVLIAAVPAPDSHGGPFEKFYDRSGYLLASGYAADPTVELLLTLRADNGNIVVFQDGNPSPLHNYSLTQRTIGTQSANAGNSGGTFGDLLSTAASPELALQPKTAVIVHGAIIVGGPLWVLQPSEPAVYELKGWGFAINQSSGAQNGWTLFWYDANEAQPHVPRGLYWCMSAAPVHNRTTNPMKVAICCSNYMFKDQPGTGNQAATARAYYFRLQRSTVGGTWSVGQTPYLNSVMSFDIRPGSTQFQSQGVTFRKVNHSHTCMATEWSAPDADTQGVQVVVSNGDSQGFARFVRYTMADYTGDYSSAANWTAYENYNGKADLESGPAEGTLSMQPGTCFFAPTAGRIWWCTDLQAEWISEMRLPNGGVSPNQAQFDHLYGWATGYGNAPDTGIRTRPVLQGLSQPRPEIATSPIAAVYDEPSLDGREPEARRVLLCPDPTKPTEWVQVAALHNWGGSPTVKIHKGYIYQCQLVTGSTIQRVPLPSFTPTEAPTLVAVRPLLVSCGGKNLVKAGAANGTGGSYFEKWEATEVVRLGRSATGGAAPVWTDPNGSLNLGSAPTLATLGLKIRSTKYPNPDDSNYAVRLRLATDDPTVWSNLPSGFAWAAGAQVRRVRCWVRDGSYNQTTSLTPNKASNIQVRPWDEDALINDGGNGSWYSCTNRWAPNTFIGVRTITSGRALGLQINSHGDGAASPNTLDDNYVYLVSGEAFDGNGAHPYPMAPETDGPDEWLSVGDFSLGTNHNWWMKLALMTPIGNWDQWAGRETSAGSGVSDRRWPLFTLWRDPGNWIEFSANCEGRGFRVRIKAQGGSVTTADFGADKQVWLPESPLLVALGYTSSSGALAIGASLGGGMVQVPASGLTWAGGGPLTVLKFRGAIGGYSNDGEVCEIRVIGGEINESGSLGSLPGAFTDLGFLNVS